MYEAYEKIKSFGIEKIFKSISQVATGKHIPAELSNFYIDIVSLRYMHIIHRLSFTESYEILNQLIAKYGGR